jgi:hypothetical protein
MKLKSIDLAVLSNLNSFYNKTTEWKQCFDLNKLPTSLSDEQRDITSLWIAKYIIESLILNKDYIEQENINFTDLCSYFQRNLEFQVKYVNAFPKISSSTHVTNMVVSVNSIFDIFHKELNLLDKIKKDYDSFNLQQELSSELDDKNKNTKKIKV